MLILTISGTELYNEETDSFYTTKDKVLRLEHSLVSLSKWESNWKKPFLTREPKTRKESIDYIKCMTITQNVEGFIYESIGSDVLKKVNTYIEHPMTATTFAKRDNHVINRDIITAEIIYYWMIKLGIPFECQKWHLNRLLTLINVCNLKEQPKLKLSKAQILARNRELNAARRKKFNSKG